MIRTANDIPACCIGPDPHPGMIRLAVAPRANHRIRFGPLNNKKEPVVTPEMAVNMIGELQKSSAKVDTALLYGPGDPLADTETTLETIQLLKSHYPELNIIVRTLGIGGLKYADKLAQAGVSEIELLIDGIEPQVLESIYAWVRPGFKTLNLSEAVEILLEEQRQAIQAFKDAGMHLRLISTLYPTVNQDHLELMAKTVAPLGADEIVLHPYVQHPEADISLEEPVQTELIELVNTISATLPARQGRPESSSASSAQEQLSKLPKPPKERPNVAVVSSNGMEVDLHLGQAPQLLVYGPREDGLTCLLECRPAPEPGAGKERWDILADRIPDCFALLAASAGERPRRILGKHGIQVIITQENIEGTVDVLYGGGKKGRGKRLGTQ